jgi:hypothetical protein
MSPRSGKLSFLGSEDEFFYHTGDVFLLPAVIGTCIFRPHSAVNLLEIALPD